MDFKEDWIVQEEQEPKVEQTLNKVTLSGIIDNRNDS